MGLCDMNERVVKYSPPGPVAEAFLHDDVFQGTKCIMGSFGSGKSSVCVMNILKRAAEMPKCKDGIRRSKFVIVRNTYRQLSNTTIRTWHEWIPQNEGHWISEGPPRHRIISGDMDLEVVFMALDGPSDVGNLLSLDCTGIWMNEFREISHAVFDGATSRVGRYPKKDLLPPGVLYNKSIICDTNPPSDDSWQFRFMESEACRTYKQPSGLGPNAENLQNLLGGRKYYEDMCLGKDPEWIKIYVHGQYGSYFDGRPIFPEYKHEIHCVSGLAGDKKYGLRIGVDFGRTPAAAIGQRDNNGCWRILDEICTEDMGAREFGELLKRVLNDRYSGYEIEQVTCDPAGDARPQTEDTTPMMCLRAVGLPARPAPSNDFTIRREAVAYYLGRLWSGKPMLQISDRCKKLSQGLMGGYSWKRVGAFGSENFRDMPDKHNLFSHVCDSLQYLLTGAGEGRVVLRKPRAKGTLPDTAVMEYSMFDSP